MAFTIDGKEVIRVGDTTTHGGRVVSGSPTMTHLGIPVARVGDRVTCPRCAGIHTIIEGAPSAFNGEHIARHGDKVSCGATLVASAQDGGSIGLTQAMGAGPHKEPIPDEEFCRQVSEIVESPNIRQGIEDLAAQTNKNGIEYAAWVVEDSPGEYKMVGVVSGEYKRVTPTPRPDNAVLQVHTHTGLDVDPSDFDWAYAEDENNFCKFYMITNVLDDDRKFYTSEGHTYNCRKRAKK